MSKFRFIGNPRDPKDSRASITYGGLVFPLGEPVEVTDEAVAAKLRGNSHFAEVATRNREPKEEAVEVYGEDGPKRFVRPNAMPASGAEGKAEVKKGR